MPHLWNTKKLAEELSHSRLSEREKMQYLLASQILFTIIMYQATYSYEEIDVFFIVEWVAVLAIAVVGTLKCYEENGGRYGDKLLERFVCLSVPLTIKITLFVYVLFYSYQLAGGPIFDLFSHLDPVYIHEYVTMGIGVLAQTLFFVRMKSHLRKVRLLAR